MLDVYLGRFREGRGGLFRGKFEVVLDGEDWESLVGLVLGRVFGVRVVMFLYFG